MNNCYCEKTEEKVKLLTVSLISNGVEICYITQSLYYFSSNTIYVNNRGSFTENPCKDFIEIKLEYIDKIKITEFVKLFSENTLVFLNINHRLSFDDKLETFGNFYLKVHNL